MKIKTSDLTGAALDWAVAKCWYNDRRVELTEGKTGVRVLRSPELDGTQFSHWFVFFASTYWEQGGPIIERETMSLCQYKSNTEPWFAEKRHFGRHHKAGRSYGEGPTPLIAVCRCYVASKLGDEVDVPNELLNGKASS